MKKLLTLLGVFGTITAVGSSVVACQNKEPKADTLPPQQKMDLSSIIVHTDLGPLDFPDELPTPEILFDALKKLNSEAMDCISFNQLKFEDLQPTSAVVTSASDYYSGRVNISYSKFDKDAVNLKDIIKVTVLGELDFNGQTTPGASLLFAKLKELNSDTMKDVIESDLTFENITPTKATVKPAPKSQKHYVGDVEITYTKKTDDGGDKEVDLKDIIKVTALGELDFNGQTTPGASLLFAKLKELNSDTMKDVIESDLTFENITPTKATVKPAPKSQKHYVGAVEITYTKKTDNGGGDKDCQTDLAEIIKVLNLGQISLTNDQPSTPDLLKAINNANPEAFLNEDDFTVKAATTQTALIVGQGRYFNSVQVTYNEVMDLVNIIKQTNLGIIELAHENPSAEELYVYTKTKNEVTMREFTFEELKFTKITATSAVIESNSTHFTGSVTLSFQRAVPVQLKNISEILKVLDLGKIALDKDKPTDEKLLTAINQVNPEAKLTANDVKIAGATNKEALIIGINNYKGAVRVVYNQKTDLKEIIVKTALGEIFSKNGGYPTAQALFERAKELNPETMACLLFKDIKFDEISADSAIVTSNSKWYEGEVTLTFQIGCVTDLNHVIEETRLGQLEINGDQPTKKQLLTAINQVNPGLNLLDSDFDIIGANSVVALIQGVGRYTGSVRLTYNAKANLEDIIKVKDLGAFKFVGAKPTESELLARLKELNPTTMYCVTKEDLNFENIVENCATIGSNSEQYDGAVQVTYSKA